MYKKLIITLIFIAGLYISCSEDSTGPTSNEVNFIKVASDSLFSSLNYSRWYHKEPLLKYSLLLETIAKEECKSLDYSNLDQFPNYTKVTSQVLDQYPSVSNIIIQHSKVGLWGSDYVKGDSYNVPIGIIDTNMNYVGIAVKKSSTPDEYYKYVGVLIYIEIKE